MFDSCITGVGRTRQGKPLPHKEYYTHMKPIKPDPFAIIHARLDVSKKVRRSAWELYQYEIAKMPRRPSQVLKRVLRWMDDQRTKEAQRRLEPTIRERHLLHLFVVRGMTMKEIALITGNNVSAIKWHFKRMRDRLGDMTLYQFVAISVDRGWVKVQWERETPRVGLSPKDN